jgi:transcription-repair coupling factor (superfamily II helicase)
LAQNASSSAAGGLFADIIKAPAVQDPRAATGAWRSVDLARHLRAAQPFFAALLPAIFPQRSIVIVTPDLKTQENFQQDLETWLAQRSIPDTRMFFYPAWEIFPHEDKLPHADVISDRLQTLVALSEKSEALKPPSKLVVTSVTALLQRTFPPGEIQKRTRTLLRGDKIAPLDLIDFLEEQGYEPEAQVSQKGEIALRGGILDVFPPTSPWPVRLEFFGDELESLREFDPLTQVSRGEISSVMLPPAGELGILKKRSREPEAGGQNEMAFATLPDYLPRETIFLLCEPESLAVHAENTRRKFPRTIHFLFPGRIFWLT